MNITDLKNKTTDISNELELIFNESDLLHYKIRKKEEHGGYVDFRNLDRRIKSGKVEFPFFIEEDENPEDSYYYFFPYFREDLEKIYANLIKNCDAIREMVIEIDNC